MRGAACSRLDNASNFGLYIASVSAFPTRVYDNTTTPAVVLLLLVKIGRLLVVCSLQRRSTASSIEVDAGLEVRVPGAKLALWLLGVGLAHDVRHLRRAAVLHHYLPGLLLRRQMLCAGPAAQAFARRCPGRAW